MQAGATPTLGWLFFSFKGRIARRSFIFSILFLLMPQIVIILQLVRHEGNTGMLTLLGLIMLALWAASIWSLFAVATKRLHDLGAPGALSIIGFFPGINWLFFVALSVLPSKAEANEYGPPPFGN